jgi:hypothetical protein
MDWQWVIEIGWRLLTKADIKRFEQMCEVRFLGPSNYGIFEDWPAINRSRDGYFRIKDRLPLDGKIQEMEDKENHYDEEPYKARVHAFFLAYHKICAYCWWLSFYPMDLEHYRKFEVSLEWAMFYAHLLISFVLMDKKSLALVSASGKYEQSTGSPTIGLMGELVKNAKLGRRVAAEGFKGPAFDPFPQGWNAE